MKKLLVSMVGLVVLSAAAIPAAAQTRARCNNQSVRRYEQRKFDRRYEGQRRVATYDENRIFDSRYRNNVYSNSAFPSGYGYDDRSTWERSRDKITTAIGAGAGAALGGIIGGKKGAILGAIAGGGGAAIYTYGVRDRD